jgi:dihydrofolate synthase / folylpolyglutamate synthase
MSSDLTSWLLEHYGQERMRPGLDRIRAALAPILPALSKTRIITIAGTNGKGETTLWLSRRLEKHSHKVWISPHIERLTERFRSENGEIEQAELGELIEQCHREVNEQHHQLSYYEFLFYVFCRWAARNPPEFLLLEVGLGGRLDAVNVFDAELILLPSISRDHQEYLGNRYDLILREKLGLLRSGTLLLSYLHLRYLRERAQQICLEAGARMLDFEGVVPLKSFEFSRRNQLLASAAYLYLTGTKIEALLDPKTFEHWVSDNTGLEHRGEVWKQQGEWVFYGSHNVDGLRKLIQFLHSGHYTFSRPPFDAVITSFSQREPGDIRAMLRMLKSSGLGKVMVTTFPHPKAAAGEELLELAKNEGLDFVEDIGPYVQLKDSKHCLVLGSYYFLGHIKSLLRQ